MSGVFGASGKMFFTSLWVFGFRVWVLYEDFRIFRGCSIDRRRARGGGLRSVSLFFVFCVFRGFEVSRYKVFPDYPGFPDMWRAWRGYGFGLGVLVIPCFIGTLRLV